LACVLKHPFPKVQAIEHLNLEYALCSAHCQGDIRPRVAHVLKHTILSLRQSIDCKLKGISGHRSRTYSDCSLKKRGPTRTSWTRECWGNKWFLLTSVGVPVFELFVQRSWTTSRWYKFFFNTGFEHWETDVCCNQWFTIKLNWWPTLIFVRDGASKRKVENHETFSRSIKHKAQSVN
jgi:hypothetical protein